LFDKNIIFQKNQDKTIKQKMNFDFGFTSGKSFKDLLTIID